MICGSSNGHLCYGDEDLCMRCEEAMCRLGARYGHRLKDCSCQVCGTDLHDCFDSDVDFCSLCNKAF